MNFPNFYLPTSLNISSVSFGEGIISKMELENIFDIGIKMFEEKIFAPFSQIYSEEVVEVPKENEIR